MISSPNFQNKYFYAAYAKEFFDAYIELSLKIGYNNAGLSSDVSNPLHNFEKAIPLKFKLQYQEKNHLNYLISRLPISFEEIVSENGKERLVCGKDRIILGQKYQISLRKTEQIFIDIPLKPNYHNETYDDKEREILDCENIFIFDLEFTKEKEKLISIENYVFQTLVFMFFFIETSNYQALDDFITQHQRHFALMREDMTTENYHVLFNNLNRFLKDNLDIHLKTNFNNFMVFVCIFGLFSKKIYNITTKYSTQILQKIINYFPLFPEICKNLKNKKGIFIAFIDGMINLILMEESILGEKAKWVDSLSTFLEADREFMEQLGQRMIKDSNELALSLSLKKMKLLINFCASDILIFSSDSIVFAEAMEIFLSKKSNQVSDICMKILPKHQGTLENYREIYEKFLKRKPNSLNSLKTISQFFRFFNSHPEVFLTNETMVMIKSYMSKGLYWEENNFLEYMHSILIKNFHPIVLTIFDKETIAPIICSFLDNPLIVKKSNNFHFNFFKMFMLEEKLSTTEFLIIFDAWNKLIDHTPNYLDLISEIHSFFEEKGHSPVISERKKIWFDSLFVELNPTEIVDILPRFLLNYQNKEILARFKEEYINKIFKTFDFKNLICFKPENPFILLEERLIKNEANVLLFDLLRSCLSFIKSPTTVQILHDLFENPQENSLVYKILTGDQRIFEGTRQMFKEAFLLIVKEIESKTLEGKWISMMKGLKESQKNLMNKMLEGVQNIYLGKTNADKSSIFDLLRVAENDFENKVEGLNLIIDVLKTYCSSASDYKEQFELIHNIRNTVHERSICDITYQDVINADKLKSYIHLESFIIFRKKLENNLEKPHTCSELLKLSFEWLQLYNSSFTNILGNKNMKLKEIENFFSAVHDFQSESENLKKVNLLIDENQQKLICEVLNFLASNKECEAMKKGLLIGLQYFDLACDANLKKALEFLLCQDSEVIAKDFHENRQFLQQNLKVDEKPRKIIKEFTEANKLLDFIFEIKNSNDIEFLKEGVDYFDENFLSLQTVFEFIKCWKFCHDLRNNLKGNKTVKNLLEEIENLANSIYYSSIQSDFSTSKKNLISIQNLYLNATDNIEAKRNQIFKIVESSKLRILKENNMVEIETKLADVGFKTYKSNDIMQMKHLANLIICTEQNNTEKNFYENVVEKFRAFDQLAESLFTLKDSLIKLKKSGHPYICSSQEFNCRNGEFNELFKFKNEIEKKVKKWYKNLHSAYQKYYELTFFRGRDFWKMERALMEGDKEKNSEVAFLLRLSGKKLQKLQMFVDEKLTLEERLYKLGESLKALPNVEDLSQVPFFREDFKEYRFFIIQTFQRPMILKAIFTMFSKVEKSFPKPFQIMICHNKTSWNELLAFAYLCYFNPQKRLFCLIEPENLPFDLQDKFSMLFKQLISNDQREFYLGFITNDENKAHLISSLNYNFRKRMLFKSEDLLNDKELKELIQELSSNVSFITSSLPGMGKTENIFKESIALGIALGLKYKKIPINGKIDPSSIVKTLIDCLREGNDVLLNFCLGSIRKEDTPILNIFLISMIFLRYLAFSKKGIEIPIKLRIIFELDSSCSEDFRKGLEIFDFIKNEHISSINWENIHCDDKELQLISYYLKNLKSNSIDNFEFPKKNLISQIEIVDLLKEQLSKNKDFNYVTLTQYKIFKTVLSSLLEGFESSIFAPDVLDFDDNMNKQNLSIMKNSIIQALIDSAELFTSKSIENVRKQQQFYMKEEGLRGKEVNENIAIYNSYENLNKATLSWENFRPFFIIFTNDHSPLFIYKNKKDIPKKFLEVIETQINVSKELKFGKAEDLMDYNNMDQKKMQFHLYKKLCELTNKIYLRNFCEICFRKFDKPITECYFCKQKNLIFSDYKNNDDYVRKVTEASLKNYVLTVDNYVKMLLIYMRVKAKIPVIIKGETGCGKTTLIRFLCTNIFEDELYVIPIHAGFTDKMIIDEMKGVIEKAKELDKNNKIWVFFDEFNTTESIGLIKEIICERTMIGKPIADNIVFLGACNPFRQKSKEILFDENVGIKKPKFDKSYNLLYTVQPLPESLIEYVWDYGQLSSASEREYIKTMFQKLDGRENNNDMLKNVVDLIGACHDYFRKLEDLSSVSLRDVTRFRTLYTWFSESLKTRMELKKKKIDKNIHEQAAILSFLHCYFLRIPDERKRIEFLNSLKINLQRFIFDTQTVLQLLEREETDFLDRMENIPKDLAKNKALKENVFALIVCIVNKIPLFICGKPGCRKSRAVQLVFSHLRGKHSYDPYFKTLPELILVPFQGSELCTSESILNVFDKAENYLKIKNDNNILPLIWFDEIGLAELSPYKPLKVLHNKLEIENIKVAFVGISNWRLDASKMNRALYLARPDPSLDDLKLTAREIFKSIRKDKEEMIGALTKIYLGLKENLKTEFFGLRDFYHLIKGVCFDLEKAADRNEKIEFQIVLKNLKKNFSGFNEEYKGMWKQYCKYRGKREKVLEISEPEELELIKSNLNEGEGRYLMIIVDNDCIAEFIESALEIHKTTSSEGNLKKLVKVVVGSKFVDDLKDNYSYRILSDVILYLQKGYTLIFKNVEHIYCCLYDLFNQNFSFNGDKKYCRIALGVLYNPTCLVNKDFHCILFMNEKDLKNADPPFLSRFEKYHLKLADILESTQQDIQDIFEKMIKKIIGEKHKKMITAKHLFPNYSKELLTFLIKRVNKKFEQKEKKEVNDDFINLCLIELIQMATFDFPVLVCENIKETHLKTDLLTSYYKSKEAGFSSFLQNLLANMGTEKFLIMTYTQINENIPYSKYNNNEITNDLVREIKLGNFKSELEIKSEFMNFFQSHHSLLVIRVNYSLEHQHLLLLKHIEENLENDESTNIKGTNKHVMIILHLQRHLINEVNFETIFTEWKTLMFDHLDKDYLFPIDCIEDRSFQKLSIFLKNKQLIRFEDILYSLIDNTLSKFQYFANEKTTEQINERRNQILENFRKNNGDIISLLTEHINNMKNIKNENEWTPQSYLNIKIIEMKSVSPLEAIIKCFENNYQYYLIQIIYEMENNWLLDAYFFAISSGNQFLQNFWKSAFKEMKFDTKKHLENQAIEITFYHNLNFPFSKIMFSHIKELIESLDIGNMSEEELLEQILETTFLETNESHFYKNLFKEASNLKSFTMDQLTLVLMENSIELSTEIAFQIIENSFASRKLFIFFFKEQKKFLRIFKNIEEIITFEQGEVIFRKAMQESFLAKSIENENFLHILFNNLVGSICSRSFLIKNSKSIEKVGNLLIRMQDYMIITDEFPENYEKLVFLLEMIKFINSYDQNPSMTINSFLNFLYTNSDEIEVNNINLINNLLKFLNEKMNCVEKLNKDKNCKFIKLNSQLLKNAVAYSQGQSKYLGEVVEQMEKTEEIWKNSAKILELINNEINFSETIMCFQGNLLSLHNGNENTEKIHKAQLYEEIFKQNNKKTLFLFLNKSLSRILFQWKDDSEKILTEKMNVFDEIVNYLAGKQEKKGYLFYSSIIWVKSYLFLFAEALNKNNEKFFRDFKKIDDLMCKNTAFHSTLRLYLTKLFIFNSKQTDPYKISCVQSLFKDFLKDKEVYSIIIQPISIEDLLLSSSEDNFSKMLLLPENEQMGKLLDILTVSKINHKIMFYNFSCFIKYYTSHISPQFVVNKVLIELLDKNKSLFFKKSGELATKFIHCLLSNFKEGSYFKIKPGDKAEDVSRKLCYLYLIASLLAQQHLETSLSKCFFVNGEFPKNFALFWENRSLFGMVEDDSILENMKDVKKSVEERLKNNQIAKDAKYIYKCSKKCDYLYIFFGCGKPMVSDPAALPYEKCPFCDTRIGAKAFNELFIRNNGLEQEIMSIEEGLKYIEDYKKNAKKIQKGYIFRKLENERKEQNKSHLKAISFRVLHWMLHSTIFTLFEIGILTEKDLKEIVPKKEKLNIAEFFKSNAENDYKFIGELLSVSAENETNVWLFELITNLEKLKNIGNKIDENLINFEQIFEEIIVLPMIVSVPSIIQNYKQRYYNIKNNGEENVIDYISEVKLNDEKYPFLEHFSLLKSPTVSDFEAQFQLFHGENPEKFPLLKLFFDEDISKINHLATIIAFSNELINKFQYQITREEAQCLKIKEISTLKNNFSDVVRAWNSLNIKEVVVDCYRKKVQKIDESIMLAFFLPNQVKDDSGLTILGVLCTLIENYNNFIYQARMSEKPGKSLQKIIEEEKNIKCQVFQSPKETLIQIDTNEILRNIVEVGYMNNFEYGKGKEIYYDFEEMEGFLRDFALGKNILSKETEIRMMNYQFETYQGNSTIITDIRKRNIQEALNMETRDQIKEILKNSEKKELLNYLGSLDYLFTYLRNKKIDTSTTIVDFSQMTIKTYENLNEFIKSKESPLALIKIACILDLYDLVEEMIMDTEDDVKNFLPEDVWNICDSNENSKVLQVFHNSIQKCKHPKIQDEKTLRKVLKKIIFRIMPGKINYEERLIDYLKREDIWDEDVPSEELGRLNLDECIKLRHTFLIWKDLNSKFQTLSHKKKDEEEKNQNLLTNTKLQNTNPQRNNKKCRK